MRVQNGLHVLKVQLSLNEIPRRKLYLGRIFLPQGLFNFNMLIAPVASDTIPSAPSVVVQLTLGEVTAVL